MGKVLGVLAIVLGGVAVAWATIPSLRSKPVPATGPSDVATGGVGASFDTIPQPDTGNLSNWPFVKKVLDFIDPLFPQVQPPPIGYSASDNSGSLDMSTVKLSAFVSALCDKWAATYALNSSIIKAQCWEESRGNQAAVSPKGALGLMQLLPATAAELEVNPNDPSDNVKGGCKYMRRLLNKYGNSYTLALAAYNAGPGNVDKYKAQIPPFPETQNYVADILTNAGVAA